MAHRFAHQSRSTFAASSALCAVSCVFGYSLFSRKGSSVTICDSISNDSVKNEPKLVFLGSGSSTGCPKPLCPLLFQRDHPQHANSPEIKALQENFKAACKVSTLAVQGNPKDNKNYRNNPSLLISFVHADSRQNIVIDVGKTFRETAIRWFPEHGVQSIDAVILTHHHMDAVGGLDDLRGFQKVHNLEALKVKGNESIPSPPPVRVSMPIFLSEECHSIVSKQFPWLFPRKDKPKKQNSGDKVVKRDVASLDVNIIQAYQPFHVKGLNVLPLPVWHGEDLVCMGFAFSITNPTTERTTNVLYLSDISRMMPETLRVIKEELPSTDILVVDSLLPNRLHPVHFHMGQAVELAKEVGARQSYLLGMDCDRFLPHDEMNAKLAEEYPKLSIQLAYDGQVIHL